MTLIAKGDIAKVFRLPLHTRRGPLIIYNCHRVSSNPAPQQHIGDQYLLRTTKGAQDEPKTSNACAT